MTTRKIAVGVATVAAVGIVFTLVSPKGAQAVSNLFVTVTNTSARPVPTVATDTRNVNVENFPSGLTVTNPSSNGVAQPLVSTDTDGTARVPIQESCQIFISSTQSTCQLPQTPAGKRLVVEQVDGGCNAGSTAKLYDVFLTTNTAAGGEVQGVHTLLPVFTAQIQDLSGNLDNEFSFSQRVRFYSDPSDNPTFNFLMQTGSGAACNGELVGYLEPVNVP